MIIIVEGIDRVGKTTLCNKLSEKFGIPIHKYKGVLSYNEMDNYNETDKILISFQILKETKSSIILDRMQFSDYVYGVLERNYSIEDAKHNFEKIDNAICNEDDVFLIYMLPTDIEESSRQHGKDLSVYDEEFYYLFKKSNIKNKFRCTYNTMDEAIMFIETRISK